MSTPPKSPSLKASQDLNHAEGLDDLLEVVNPKGWIALACLGIIIVLIVLWSVLGRIPVTVTGSGILTHPHKVVGLQSIGTGKLRDLRLQPGQPIKAGDIVAVLDLPELNRQLSELRAKLSLQEAQSTEILDLQAHDNQLELKAIAEQEQNLRRIIGQLKTVDSTYKARLEDRRRLYQLKALPIDSVIDAEQSYRNNHDRIPDLETKLQQIQLRRAQMTHQFIDLKTARSIQSKDLAAQIALLEAQAANQEQVKSRFSGRVLEVSATMGQVLTPGTRLGMVEVEDSSQPLVALLYFPIRDGKKVLPGQEAQTTPDTVKRDRYGGITGRVLTVSAFPVSKQAMGNALGNDDLAGTLSSGGPQIEVTVQLEREPKTPNGFHWSASEGPPILQTPGTTVTCRVTVETLTPLQLAISLLRQASAIY